MTRELQLLEQIGGAQADGSWHQLESLLYEFAPYMRDDLVAPLLSTLVDNMDHEPEAFGLVHLAETIDDEAYTRSVISALPELHSKAPRWARTLVTRLLNSEECYSALLAIAPYASPAEKRALKAVNEGIRGWRPERFLDKTAELAARLDPSTLGTE